MIRIEVMDDLDEFIEWVAEREEDEQLLEWLQMIGSFVERQDPPIKQLH